MAEPRGQIAIVGGSMAGLMAGLLLRRRGWQVDIYERSGEELASRGAGISPHATLFEAFAEAGLDLSRAFGVESRGRLIFAPDGEIAASIDEPQLFTSWGLLYRFLRAAFPDAHYHNGVAINDVAQHDSGCMLTTETGDTHDADWVIGADGVRSSIRRFVAAQPEVEYCGYVAWRGLCHEADIDAEVRAKTEGRMSFCLPPGEHMLGYTVAGPGDELTPGQRWYNWVWYRPAAPSSLQDMMTGDDGVHYQDGIPPHRITADTIAEMRRDADTLLAPPFAHIAARIAQPFIQPIVEVASQPLRHGRACLIGDAAFTVRPHIGCGVSKAAGDALSLARVFALGDESLDDALTTWSDERLRYGRACYRRSADLGCYLSGPAASSDEQARHDRYRNDETILHGIAAPNPDQFLSFEEDTA